MAGEGNNSNHIDLFFIILISNIKQQRYKQFDNRNAVGQHGIGMWIKIEETEIKI